MVHADPALVHTLVFDQLRESFFRRCAFGLALCQLEGAFLLFAELVRVGNNRLTWTPVNIRFLEPNLFQPRIGGIAAGN